jgi:GNAT superfamily N-acetyltransferase
MIGPAQRGRCSHARPPWTLPDGSRVLHGEELSWFTAAWHYRLMADDRVRIRPYEERDRQAARSLAARLVIGVAPWRNRTAVGHAVRGWVEGSLNESTAEGRAVFVAVHVEEVVGLISVGTRKHFTGDVDAYVGELVVAEAMERRGFGARLLGAAEAWAVERGLERLTLETGAANSGARAFYAAAGYVEEDVRLTKEISG